MTRDINNYVIENMKFNFILKKELKKGVVNRVKSLFNDGVYVLGSCDKKTKEINVYLGSIYVCSNNYIKEICDTIAHEHLHLLLDFGDEQEHSIIGRMGFGNE